MTRTAALSVLAVGIAYRVGQVGKYFIVHRLGDMARRTPGWGDAVVPAVGRRVPFWSLPGVETFELFVRFHASGDPGIGFSVILRARELVDQFLIKHEFVKHLHRRYAAEGTSIPLRALAPPRHKLPSPPPPSPAP